MSMPSHGAMVRDGQLRLNMPDLWDSLCCPEHFHAIPWYNVQDGQLGLNTPSSVMWDSSGRPIHVHAVSWYNGTG